MLEVDVDMDVELLVELVEVVVPPAAGAVGLKLT